MNRFDRVTSILLLLQTRSVVTARFLSDHFNVTERTFYRDIRTLEVELFFGPEAARFVGEQRYMFGFIDEERQTDGVKMRFLTPVPEYMARWLLQYTDDVEVIRGDSIRTALQRFSAQLAAHWDGKSKLS